MANIARHEHELLAYATQSGRGHFPYWLLTQAG